MISMNSLRAITLFGSRSCGATAVLAAAFVLSGCHTLPDVQPFADATSKLHHTIASSGDEAVSQIRLIGEKNSGTVSNATEVANNLANRLAADWEARKKVMEGLDAYASALTAVVQSGNEGAKNARAVGDAVSNLASSLNIAFPGGGTASASVTQLASDLFAIAAREWAAHVLIQRLTELDPKIKQVAQLLATDLANIKNIEWAAKAQALATLANGSPDVVKVNTLISRRTTAAQDVLHAPLVSSPAQPGLSDRINVLHAVNEVLDLETKSAGYTNYLASVAAVERAYQDQSAILDQAVLLLHAWAGAHHQMLVAVQEKRPPSLQELSQIASDLQEVYKQIHTKTNP
jgi:hypothetical protein